MFTLEWYCLQVLGWGLLSQFSPFRYFPHFPLLSKQMLAIEYHVYIWQVSPQLSCSDTCQIWMWFKESNRYFCKIKILLTEKLANGALITPTPGPRQIWRPHDDAFCFLHYWPFVRGIHLSLVVYPHKGPVLCNLNDFFVVHFETLDSLMM